MKAFRKGEIVWLKPFNKTSRKEREEYESKNLFTELTEGAYGHPAIILYESRKDKGYAIILLVSTPASLGALIECLQMLKFTELSRFGCHEAGEVPWEKGPKRCSYPHGSVPKHHYVSVGSAEKADASIAALQQKGEHKLDVNTWAYMQSVYVLPWKALWKIKHETEFSPLEDRSLRYARGLVAMACDVWPDVWNSFDARLPLSPPLTSSSSSTSTSTSASSTPSSSPRPSPHPPRPPRPSPPPQPLQPTRPTTPSPSPLPLPPLSIARNSTLQQSPSPTASSKSAEACRPSWKSLSKLVSKFLPTFKPESLSRQTIAEAERL